jgi:hypothetical protein
MPSQPQQFPVGSPGPQNSPAWMANPDETAVTFINNDVANTVYLGNVNTITVGGGNTISLLAGSSITLPGTKTWYTTAIPGTATLTVAPGSIQYSPFSTGFAQELVLGTAIAPGTVISVGAVSGPINVANYNSYDICAAAHCPNQANAGAPYTMVIRLAWYDTPTLNNLLGVDQWEIWVSNTQITVPIGQAGVVSGSGPMLGPWMTVQVTNPSATELSVIDLMAIAGNSRTVTASDWRQTPPVMASPISTLQAEPAALEPSGIYESIAASQINMALAASTEYWMPLPLFAGTFNIRWLISVALASTPILAHGARITYGGVVAGASNPGTMWNPGNTANTEETTTLIAPRVPMYIVFNTTATAPSISVSIMILGKPS